jgi:hypothetical protein
MQAYSGFRAPGAARRPQPGCDILAICLDGAQVGRIPSQPLIPKDATSLTLANLAFVAFAVVLLISDLEVLTGLTFLSFIYLSRSFPASCRLRYLHSQRPSRQSHRTIELLKGNDIAV